MDFGAGKSVNIKRVRYFPTMSWVIAGQYILGAKFEASNDGVTYTEVGVVDETVHVGWNSFLVDTASNYRYIRMSHNSTSGCQLAEFEVFGVQMSDATVSSLSAYTTNAIVTDGQNTYTFTSMIEYGSSYTPTVTSISPSTGTIYGGDTITMTGTNFNIGTVEVTIDGIECVVNTGATTATNIECVTGERLALPEKNSFVVRVGGNKAVLSANFEYIMAWSDERTWGTDLPPVEGDLVVVPAGMALYVDVSTPKLEGIVVEGGKLIFADEGGAIEVHTGFITLNGGEFRAGTIGNPYQSQLTFIMYGGYYGKQQPMVGNKGIGCIKCKLSMYGKERTRTWTTLASTVSAGATTFTVSQAVDWAVG